MKLLRQTLDKFAHHFEHGGKLEKFFPLYEGLDTFLYTPGTVTSGRTHVRDALDSKRMMTTVIYALLPAIIFGIYHVGFQAASNVVNSGVPIVDWHLQFYSWLGLDFEPSCYVKSFILGLIYFIPIYAVTQIAGGFWEVLFSIVRKHEINEGFFVTGFLFPLILPPTIPLWQVAVGISFGVVIGKEVFGGVGKNFLNPALVARAFLFFAYPGQISGDQVWIMDGITGATALGQAATGGLAAIGFSFQDAFLGFIPGSIGETSTVAILFGAVFLIVTGVGSWRIMLSVVLSALFFSSIFYSIGSPSNAMFSIPPWWHLVLGGFAFGTVFMATDPVSAAMTNVGKYFYGALIGFMVILIRVINPAFPEGMMLAILFGNIFAPLIDYFVVESYIKRRRARI